ncbi:hypothetical protein Q1695_001114 [Nippostrongylus brasiliensis]|nr:hypothetical protein Q1695_001114 [Nippostrongylus brasiliensis]
MRLPVILLLILRSFATRDDSDEETYVDICEHPWQTHEQNILATYSQCSEFQDSGVQCTPHDPIECTGRNPVCLLSKQTNDYRCCSDVPQDLSNPPGIPEQVKPICPYGASSYDIPSVLLCDPTESNACPDEYTCEQVVLNEHAQTGATSAPEIRTGDHFSMLPYRFRKPVYLKKVVLLHDQMRNEFHHVLVLYNPHGNPEAMNFYYNRPSSLSREIVLTVPAWDEGIFFRNMNRVLTIQSDQSSTKQVRKLYIVLVFQTKRRLTMRNSQTWRDLHANYTSFTEFLSSETESQPTSHNYTATATKRRLERTHHYSFPEY